ncbi:hypothetical protein ON010_g9685 [Phytophthora cinnamomi]|nr:hypothetical protein ON010_g9685 [Phytophthora cinnamomi]
MATRSSTQRPVTRSASNAVDEKQSQAGRLFRVLKGYVKSRRTLRTELTAGTLDVGRALVAARTYALED